MRKKEKKKEKRKKLESVTGIQNQEESLTFVDGRIRYRMNPIFTS